MDKPGSITIWDQFDSFVGLIDLETREWRLFFCLQSPVIYTTISVWHWFRTVLNGSAVDWKAVKLTHSFLPCYFLLCYNVDTSFMQPGLQKAHLIALCLITFSSEASLTAIVSFSSIPSTGGEIHYSLVWYIDHPHTYTSPIFHQWAWNTAILLSE